MCLQCVSVCCSVLQCVFSVFAVCLQCVVVCCSANVEHRGHWKWKILVQTDSTLQHAATHCNTLQYTATHCNTLQHTATHCNTLQNNKDRRSSKELQVGHSCSNSLKIIRITLSAPPPASTHTPNRHVASTNMDCHTYECHISPIMTQNITHKISIPCGAVWCSEVQCVDVCCSVLQCVCSVLQCVAVFLQCVAVCCSVFAVCCSVLQCAAGYCVFS